MEKMQNIKNLLYPFQHFVALLISLPFYLIYNSIYSFIKSFLPENVAGKVILITGASSGIGEHLAYEYAKRKAKLVLVARRENLLQQVAQRARELGSPEVMLTCADVSKPEDCKRFIKEAVNQFGHLDHLVNNAGILNVSSFEESCDIGNMTSLMDVNFWGSVYATQFAIPHLKKTRGKIIVNSSVSGWLSTPTISLYGASKAALISFFETLRIELRSQITITIACPAYTDSEMTRGKLISMEGGVEDDQEKIAGLMGNFPVKSAEEAARIIVDGACCGKKHILDPSWLKVFFLCKALFPEVLEWYLYHLHSSGHPVSETEKSHMKQNME